MQLPTSADTVRDNIAREANHITEITILTQLQESTLKKL